MEAVVTHVTTRRAAICVAVTLASQSILFFHIYVAVR